MANVTSSHLLVAAFDFGTTYSGYALSFRNDPLKIQINQCWIAGSTPLMSLKTPTCVLLNPQREFDSFGYEAENKFASLADEDQHADWLFFRRFKMLLHNNQTLSRKTTVEDICGRQMNAMTIFAMSMRYLRKHLLTALNNQKTGMLETDILYVLTLPAIWNDSAKQFMREAAEEAGIDTTRLKLALEPEAASIWCQVDADAKAALGESGAKYMVVDLGGGTADITVHEKLAGGTLRELHKASGGPWGGINVDNNYIMWLERIFGKAAVERFKKEHMDDYLYVLREFECVKRSVKLDPDAVTCFKIPVFLRESSEYNDDEALQRRLQTLKLKDSVTLIRDKMKVNSTIVTGWFKDPVDKVIQHVQGILTEPKMEKVKTILLVGGFSDSIYVQKTFRNTFLTMKVLVPADAALAVLKGAVRFGHEPTVVSERVMRCTYGVRANKKYDPSKHPPERKVIVQGQEIVKHTFSVFVRAGDSIRLGHEVKKTFAPVWMDKTSVPVFCTTEQEPEFTYDPGCSQIGELEIEHPDGETLDDKKNEVTMIFGETELSVKAKILKTGKEFDIKINCLN